MKKCKHCQTEIPKKAKVCPNCHKKLKGKGCLIVFLIFFIIYGGILVSVISKHSTSEPKDANKVVEEQKNDFKLDKQTLEEHITTTVGLKEPKYSIVNYRSWDDGSGFTVVQNTFEVDGVEHSYTARIGKDGVTYKLVIDDEVIIKANADQLMEYAEKYPEE